ncbi:MAG: ATP-binding protein [Chloroflexi bacterium]|nr:ATP-binding protein [Chloroflexota bacterium]
MPLTDSSLFYLGRRYDLAQKKLLDEPVQYDPADLTTHMVVTGMTGSGKTGMCIAVLEEAALQKIPAIIIDPKGDLTNLLLHFPDQASKDFEPWIDPAEAQREGKSVAALAEETAARWKEGLGQWGLGREQLLALNERVQYSIFTPGSSASQPINILTAFEAPDLPWEQNEEILREELASNVTALLSLLGLNDIDPLRSREHILLANILENAWKQGQPMDLTRLIQQVQKPPFERLGAFLVDDLYPEKERFELAMLINNFLASPSFQEWLEGQPLDVQSLLYMPDGKPRHSIFYLAHLSDTERMFFVSLLLSAVEAWMRTQRGTSALRALLCFDEILGYLPPVANPPSRPILLRLIKQARAFGLGLVLSTQNPVDLDYKALSNAGTWLVGRLQTERDKMRLLDGLESVAGGVARSEYDRIISSLQKRVFLLHSVHLKGPQVLQSRWALNYLAGPLTRAQLPALRQLAGEEVTAPLPAEQPSQPAAVASSPASSGGYLSTRPAIAGEVEEYFLPANVDLSKAGGTAQGMVYRPALLAQAEVRYYNRRYNLDTARHPTVVVSQEGSGPIHWDKTAMAIDADSLQRQPLPQAQFVPLPGWLADERRLKDLQDDFEEWVYRSGTIQVWVNQPLKVYAGPEVSQAEFREMCSKAARDGLEAEAQKAQFAQNKKLETLRQKVSRQELEVKEKEKDVEQRRLEMMGSGGELLLSAFTGRRRSVSSTISKNRLLQKAKSDLEQEQQSLVSLQKQLQDLQQEQQDSLGDVKERWAQAANAVEEVPINPTKKDIFIERFGVVWVPYYRIGTGEQRSETPAYQS